MKYELSVKRVSKKDETAATFTYSSESHKTILNCYKHALDVMLSLGKYSNYYDWLKYCTHILSREIEDCEYGIKVLKKFESYYYTNETYRFFVAMSIN